MNYNPTPASRIQSIIALIQALEDLQLENEVFLQREEKINIINKRIRQMYKTRGPNLMEIPDLKVEKEKF